jgi:hypothetical protein
MDTPPVPHPPYPPRDPIFPWHVSTGASPRTGTSGRAFAPEGVHVRKIAQKTITIVGISKNIPYQTFQLFVLFKLYLFFFNQIEKTIQKRKISRGKK